MRVSNNWLKELVDIDLPALQIANDMLYVGNEYDSITEISPATNLVVGRVVSVNSHPDSDHLNVCEVDLGDKIYQIVCGAKNVRANQKVIVSKVGAKLPAGEIKKSVIRGVESNGMICSLAELGLESKYVTEEDKKGIHVLPEDAPVGVDAKEYLGFDDVYVDYDLTANRSDLLNMFGVAYEVAAIYDKKVNIPEFDMNEIKEKTSGLISIECRTDNCKAYTARIVKNVTIGESPEFIKSRLMAAGIRPINNVVDISNYVMLEYGQPLHFFDLDKITSKIIIRQASENEELVTLDGKQRILKPSDIVIADEHHAVALAGVMGGLYSEVTKDTKNILIESAIFNPYNIRYTSKEILRSEASIRYEKGIDPNRCKPALNRAAYLLSKYANGEILSDIVGFNNCNLEDKVIEVTTTKINKVLGMNIDTNEIGDIFRRLGFVYSYINDTFKVSVPTRRLDINIKEDLIEEVGRIHSYKNMIGSLPITSIKRGKYLPKYKYIKDIKNRLMALGLDETINYSLVNKEEIKLFNNEDHGYVVVASPLTEDKCIMRHSIVPSLIKVCEYNLKRGIKDVNIFEASKVYYKDEDYKEVNKLAFLSSGEYLSCDWNNKVNVDFYVVKGILENLLSYLGLIKRYKLDTSKVLKDMHPYMSASILVDNIDIGYIGKIHPVISKKDIYVCELNIDKLFDIAISPIKSKDVAKYPSVIKDMAFILDNDISVGSIISSITKKGGRIVSNVQVFDVFNNILPGKKSVAFKITFQDINKTLTEDEVLKTFNELISYIEKEYKCELRNK